jgi:hypothetical protein
MLVMCKNKEKKEAFKLITMHVTTKMFSLFRYFVLKGILNFIQFRILGILIITHVLTAHTN